MKLGIDLSTTKTGWCLKKDNTYQFGIVELWSNDYATMHKKCKDFALFIRQKNGWDKLDIAIELSNFSNAKLTTKFNLLAGILIANFYYATVPSSLKMFNANEWYKFIGDLKSERAERKANSIKVAEKLINQHIFDDNIADAINIANNLEKCRDNQVIIEAVKQEKQKKKDMLKAALAKEKKINKLQNKIIFAKKDKTKEKYSTMLNEIKNGKK